MLQTDLWASWQLHREGQEPRGCLDILRALVCLARLGQDHDCSVNAGCPVHAKQPSLRRLVSSIAGVAAPLLNDDAGEDVGEGEQTLYLHVRLKVSMVGQCMMYALIPRSPPWVFCLLLFPETKAEALSFLHKMWNTYHCDPELFQAASATSSDEAL